MLAEDQEFEFDSIEKSAVGVAADAAPSAGNVVYGAPYKIDGVWKRTVRILTTHKAPVDRVWPLAKKSYVCVDDEVYDAVLIEKSTGITYVTQLIFDSETKAYYVYLRWAETEYKLDGPYDTIEVAKDAFQLAYKEMFGVEWKERETTTSEKWTYEVKTYETYEEVEEVEKIIEETEAELIRACEKDPVVDDTIVAEGTTTAANEDEVALEHDTKEAVAVEGAVEQEEAVKEPVIRAEIGVVVQPTVNEKVSWSRRAFSGVGNATSGALRKVGGVWKRTVRVHTTPMAKVDHLCPIAKTASVYYDDKAHDAVFTEKSTNITSVIQLLFDSETKVYYVYYRWGETDYRLDGAHETVESGKEAFQVTCKEKFGVEWTERETTISEKCTYEVRSYMYETFEEVEEVEEVVEETEAEPIIARQKEIEVEELDKTALLAEGRKGGSVGLDPVAIAAAVSASTM
ncbi:hypothetical protein BGZ72_005211 [Mortierella alpina]|nr:hypothetical protein BGZ72_005211 [Mortierella alpina]